MNHKVISQTIACLSILSLICHNNITMCMKKAKQQKSVDRYLNEEKEKLINARDKLLDVQKNKKLLFKLVESTNPLKEKKIRTIIKKYPQLVNATKEGKTPLWLHINYHRFSYMYYGDTKNRPVKYSLAKFLLENGANPNSIHYKTEIFLIGGSLDVTYNNIATAIWLACKDNNPKMVKLLLKYGAQKHINVACGYDHTTPLLVSCENDNAEIVALLLKHGARKSVNVANYLRITPLWLACFNLKIFELFRKQFSVTTFKKNISPLLLNACGWYNCSKTAKFLLEHGADVNITDESKHTPLHHAIKNNNSDMIALLLKHGASIHVTNYE